jgi:hypothetical protein
MHKVDTALFDFLLDRTELAKNRNQTEWKSTSLTVLRILQWANIFFKNRRELWFQ